MKLFQISLKNVLNSWWRSLTLGTFVFFVSFLLVVFNSFVLTIRTNMQNAIIQSVSGDIQIRPGKTKENDMFPMKGNWNDVSYFKAADLDNIEKTLSRLYPQEDYTRVVRQNGLILSDEEKEGAMIIGLEPKSMAYRKSLILDDGHYLGGSNEIIIGTKMAEKLKVKVGDTVGVMAQSRDGYTVDAALTVAGIGSLDILSTFGFYPVYMDLKSAQTLTGFEKNEASDILVFIPDRLHALTAVKTLKTELKKDGFAPEQAKITTWKEMGGFLMGIISIYSVMFNSFIGVLMLVVCILIINLIFMMGLERRQEIGTLRAIGFGKYQIVKIFMGEIMLISVFFSTLGFSIASALILFFSRIPIRATPPTDYVTGRIFYIQYSLGQMLPGFLVIIALTFFAAFYPSYKAAAVRPAETLKEI